MIPTHQQVDKSPLSPEGQKLSLAIANTVYDEQSIEMIKQALQNTKSPDAIVPQVALAATTILHKAQDKLDQLPEEEVWGKGGIVHLCLDSIFEVAKVLGYKAPVTELKRAYEMTEQMLEQQKGGDQEGPQEDAQEPNEMQQAAMQQQGGMPQEAAQPQGAPNMMQQAAMGGMQ
jgi:hypothetical protein